MWRTAYLTRKLAKVVVGTPVVVGSSFFAHELLQRERFAVNKVETVSQDSQSRVVVLGGGVVGIATAYFLTLKGLRVTVLEQASCAGEGTSGASGCLLSVTSCKPMVSPQYIRRVIDAVCRSDPWLEVQWSAVLDFELIRWAVRVLGSAFSATVRQQNEEFLRQHSPYFVQLIHEVAEAEGFAGDFCSSQNGLLTVYSSQASFDVACKTVQASGAIALSRKEVLEREPFLESSSISVAGATFAPADAHADCGGFTKLLAKACEKRGASLRYSTHVDSLRIATSGTGVSRVVSALLSDGTEVEGDLFVVAMGSQSPRLLRPLGVDLPIYPVKGYSYEIDGGIGHGLKSPVVFAEHQLGAIPLGDRLRFSSVAEFAGWDEWSATAHVASRFRKDLEGLFPNVAGGGALERAKLIVGGRPTTPDDLPIVSGTRFPNLIVNAGHCMRGWRSSCGSAAVLAALATDGPVPNNIDTDMLSLSRFRAIWRG